jgi:hypothetical protein
VIASHSCTCRATQLHIVRNIFLRLEYFFTRSRRNGARKRAIALAESRSRCLAGECEHARECESRRSSAEQSSLAHYDRGAAPMPAFSPATLFSPRAEKYLIIEILYLRRYTTTVHVQCTRTVPSKVVVIKFIFVSFVIGPSKSFIFPYFQQENLRRKYNYAPYTYNKEVLLYV